MRDHDWFTCRFTPNGERLLRLGNDGTPAAGQVRSSRATDGAPQWSLEVPGVRLADVTFAPDGRALLVTNGRPYDLDTRVGEARAAEDLPKTTVCAEFAPRSGTLWLALADGTIVRAARSK